MKMLLPLWIAAWFSGAVIADDSLGPIPERRPELSRPFYEPEFPRPSYEMPEGLREFFGRYPAPYGRSYYSEYHYESYGPGPRPLAPTYPVQPQRAQVNWHPIFGADGSRVTSVDGHPIPEGARFYGFSGGKIYFSR